MNLKNLFLGAALLATTVNLSATPVPYNVTISGGANVVAAPASDLGNFGAATVTAWIASDILAYNSLNSGNLPTPAALNYPATSVTSANGATSITLNLSGYDYLFLHWGGQDGGWAQLFYVAGTTGDYTFDNSQIGTGQGPSVGGISGYAYYGGTTVPDGGSTLVMLGMALSGAGLVIRRLKQ